MTNYRLVLTTTDSREKAGQIATTLVERHLAGCVQIVGPMTSVYRWQGQVEQSIEWLCLIKSDQKSYPAVEARIREIHDYEVPEIVALPIESGSENYLAWLGSSLNG